MSRSREEYSRKAQWEKWQRTLQRRQASAEQFRLTIPAMLIIGLAFLLAMIIAVPFLAKEETLGSKTAPQIAASKNSTQESRPEQQLASRRRPRAEPARWESANDEQHSLPSGIRVRGSVPSKSDGIRKEYIVEDAPPDIRARTAPLFRHKGGIVFRVTIVSEMRCMEGDLDIIRREVLESKKPRLIMTLEPMSGDSPFLDPMLQEVQLQDLRQGKTFTFIVPESDEARHLALYICMDSAEENSCRNKKLVDLGDLYQPKNRKEKYGTSTVGTRNVADKVYYFHYFLLNREWVTAFDNFLEEDKYGELEDYLGSRIGEPSEASAITAKLKLVNGTVQSMPARVSRQFIQINLPRHERGKCLEKKIQFPKALIRKLEKKGVNLGFK